MEEEEEEKLESQLKLLKPIDVRWLSIYTVIERIHQLYPALISALEVINENEDCVIAEGLLSRMKSVHFVSLLHIFRDLLNFLDPLNSIFQDQSLTIDQAFREIDTTIKNLEELASSGSLGDFFGEFYHANQGLEEIKFHDVILTRLYGVTLESMAKKSKSLHKSLLENLKERFPCQEELKPFTIFDLKTISEKDEKERKEYGNDYLKKLCEVYDIDKIQGLSEWSKFKTFVHSNYAAEKSKLWSLALASPLYATLHKLFQIYLVVPLSTASCERTFSRMNLIKK